MLLLEAARLLPRLERADFVDVAPFQCAYAVRLLAAVRFSRSPGDLRDWFATKVHPELEEHFAARGQRFPLENVMSALENLFGCRFFFDVGALDEARRVAERTVIHMGDIVSHVAVAEAPGGDCDFCCLGNVADYLPLERLDALWAACAPRGVPILLLLTSACPDASSVRRSWEDGGFSPHPASRELDEMNRGLGSATLARSWNRPGTYTLLIPAAKGA
jgi:hypothetical protein